MRRLGIIAALLATAAGCSRPTIGPRDDAAPVPAIGAAETGDAAERPIVQVRGFSNSSLVTVVAWDAADDVMSLRSSLDRAGLIIGERRFGGDHRLSLNYLYARSMGGFKYATDGSGRLFLKTGGSRDVYACFYGGRCAPRNAIGVDIPDSLLRANRDSLVLRLVPAVGEQWTLTVRHDLIAAYLTKVDSVAGTIRKSAAEH